MWLDPSAYRFVPASWVIFAAGVVSCIVLTLAWKRRPAPGAATLALLEAAITVWCFAAALESAASTVPLRLLWSQISYIGIVSSPVLYAMFVGTYTGYIQRVRIWQGLALAIIPVTTLILAFTNPLHGLIWSEIVLPPGSWVATYHHGPWFYLFICYCYALLMVGATILVVALRRTRAVLRLQLLLMLLASTLTLGGNAAYVFGYTPWPGMDWSPLFFMFEGLLLLIIFSRLGIFDLVPVAHATLMDTLSDAVLVLDGAGRVVDVNPALLHLCQGTAKKMLGRAADVVLHDCPDLLTRLAPDSDDEAEITLTVDGEVHYYDLGRTMLPTRRGQLTGWIVVLRDITHRRQAEIERERLMEELRVAFSQVRTLSGLLPICAHCKKIRDDQGYWHTVETYVRDHSEADFTHGICPECMRRLYPELAERESGDVAYGEG